MIFLTETSYDDWVDHKLFIKSLKSCLLIRNRPPILVAFKFLPKRFFKCQLYGASETKFKARAMAIFNAHGFLTGANSI